MENLKPCPFCGGTPFLYVKPIRGYKGNFSYRVLCTKCAAYVPIGEVHDLYMDAELAEQTATAAWNRRANDDRTYS